MSSFLNNEQMDILLKQKFGSDYDGFGSPEYEKVLFYFTHMPESSVKTMISGVVAFNELCNEAVKAKTLGEIIKLLNKYDKSVIYKYGQVIETLRSMGLRPDATSKIFHELHKTVVAAQKKTNRTLTKISTSFVEEANKLALAFSSLPAESKTYLISEVYSNCVSRMRLAWQKIDPEEFAGVVDTLMHDFGEDSLSDDEVIDLSKKCATIFCDSSRQKIKDLEAVLGDYKNFILGQIAENADAYLLEKSYLDDYKFVNVLKQAASIGKFEKKQLLRVAKFLEGQSVGQIYSDIIVDKNNDDYDLVNEFENIKIDLSVKEMIWVLSKNPSLFGRSIVNDLKVLKQVQKSFEANYGKSMKDFDFGELFTKENFLKGFPSLESGENMSANIEILSGFVTEEQLAKCLKTDMRILGAPNGVLRAALVQALKTAKTQEDLVQNINKIFKNTSSLLAEGKVTAPAEAGTNKSDGTRKESILPDLKLPAEKTQDVSVDLDFKKLNELFGSDFAAFAQKLFPTTVDTRKIEDVIGNQRFHVGTVAEGESGISIERLSSFARNKSGMEQANPIEVLVQFGTKIDSAIKLMDLYLSSDEFAGRSDKMQICSSQYFSLASEKDDVLRFVQTHLNCDAGEKEKLETMVENKFDELTKKYAIIAGSDSKYLDEYVIKLESENERLERIIAENAFQGVLEGDSFVGPEKPVKDLREEQVSLKQELERIEEEQIALKKRMTEEQNGLLDEGIVLVDGAQKMFRLLDVELSETEKEINAEISALKTKSREVLFDIGRLERRILAVEKRLLDGKRNAQNNELVASLMERLNKIRAKLEYAKRVRGQVSPQTPDERES